MTDSTLHEAIKEAYATAPDNDVTLYTIEIRHPAFVDTNNQPTAIRVVQNNEDIIATLEATAPLNPNTAVTFIAFGFDLVPPEVSDTANPQIQLTIDNVSTEVERNISLATASGIKAEITLRIYLASDLSGPQNDPPITLTVTDILADDLKVTCTCSFSDPANKLFPGEIYSIKRFPSLSR